ncbi:MAG: sigma-54 dependent transcriptional regulator [Candidatus Krumholzibacteria bacterium]|nr:sigma-54 dependent transcriptional regulator [Candidatus Krumholzibacteria bacterium]
MAIILVVDDEDKICKLLQDQLNDGGHSALGITSPLKALDSVRARPPDILLTDLRMEEMDGITLLKKVKNLSPSTDIIVMTAYASVETALETMRQGAYDYIIKPFTTEELMMLVERIDEKRRLQIENKELHSYIASGVGDEIVGSSPSIANVKKLIKDLANSEAPVLIRGESGTGKELVAKAIHSSSQRADGPFIAINCAAIPDTLLESELFGYERGAFTGATRRKLGHFQLAHGGTLFLDEIGDLPSGLQSKLLRVIEDHQISPLGGEKDIKVDIRLVTATHQPLEQKIKSGEFREDLYYRINVFPIDLPPLRDRREDIQSITHHLLSSLGRDTVDLTEAALRRLQVYNWPGNVRELRNVLERAVIVRPQGDIEAEHILLGTPRLESKAEEPVETLNLEDMEKQMILRALRITAGNKSEAARLLGITRRALYGRLERYGVGE